MNPADPAGSALLPWHRDAWHLFVAALDQGRLPHGLLVAGPAGVLKRELVDRFVAALFCRERPPGGAACGQCRGCRLFRAGTHPDWHRATLEDDSRQLRVAQVRELARKAMLTSSEGGPQVFVVDPADRLNVNAANALLKTLEEPRPGTLLLLVAEAPRNLPVTVLSRCQRIAVPLPDAAVAASWLAAACPDADDATRALALEAAAGAPGIARRLLADELLGLYRDTLGSLVEVSGGRQDALAVAARWADSQPSLRLAWVAQALHGAAWARARGQAARLTVPGDLATFSDLAASVIQARSLLESNLRPEQLIESVLLDCAAGRVRKPGDRAW